MTKREDIDWEVSFSGTERLETRNVLPLEKGEGNRGDWCKAKIWSVHSFPTLSTRNNAQENIPLEDVEIFDKAASLGCTK